MTTERGLVSPTKETEIALHEEIILAKRQITDNLDQILTVLPQRVHRALAPYLEEHSDLLELVLDLGRPAEARFGNNLHVDLLPASDDPMDTANEVTLDDIDHVISRISDFGFDNRAGIERTLHRISCIRNRAGRVIGLTLRIGRAVYGTVDIIRDIVESGKSILMLGRPGVGKTTKLREVARILSAEFRKRVVIVDTSNEIAGDGDIPHPAIGRSRRMQVKRPEEQHAVMIEAVENHMPQVIVIDEIGTEQEAFAARTIAERGVQLVGTAHGNSLENLLLNPTLSDLVGGIQSVTLGDDEAKRRGTQKTVLERKAPPTFDVIIEIMEVDKLAIHHDVAKVVDKMLRGQLPRPEIRVRNTGGVVEVVQKAELPPDRPGEKTGGTYGMTFEPEPIPFSPSLPEGRSQGMGSGMGTERKSFGQSGKTVHLFPYGVSRSRLERAMANLRVPGVVARDMKDADLIIALKATFRREPAKIHEARGKHIPTFVVRSNTYIQIESALREVFGLQPTVLPTDEEAAISEASDAIEHVQETGEAVELAPQNAYVRRLQHQLVERAELGSESLGVEPRRRLKILPNTLV
ncbi:R3H domain-containing nucleic acid-binding protein [Armatimonas sp.]|uniref:R3H domain-containing nucleic acid-binding protein n=1 Tax=Armatimonas sp. TaxID=1872638 RepID=UPI00374DA02F